ncbi:MAG: NAD-dependent succinate-semialdehyde dehydrogenase [Leptospiraceae bacterium]|nr:NAD-dependent succinate-semialdehyde dehydrogenase [Leptospiraceae bacterium]
MISLKNPSLFLQNAIIHGERVSSKETLTIVNPATGETVGMVPYLGAIETRKAIDSTSLALPFWKKLPAKQRANILKEWYRLILENSDDLASIITQEQGKPLAESKAEILYAASYVEWFSEEAKRVYGDIIPSHRVDTKILVLKEPVGVVATITPWNFPAAMLARKVAPAFAVGCTVVSKPAELTPFTALALYALAEKAGLPPGVWNLVMGDYTAIGKELTSNPIVKKISFTGSTQTGAKLYAQSADSIKKLSLEMGGNAPFLVFADADLDEAVKGAMLSKYRNSGQTCVCVNRFYCHETIANEFALKLAEKVSALKLGNGLEEGVTQGPLISKSALEKVQTHIEDAISKGAKLIHGGKPSSLGKTFFEPTVIMGLNSSMKISVEETFGPVSAIQTFSTDEEALQLANSTPYGLAGYFYTKDIARIFKIAEGLEVGMVGINEGIISSEQVPFGGVKFSGMGREGSKYGIDDYLNIKYLCLGGMNT